MIPATAALPTLEQRIAATRPPAGSPVMYQSWGKLLFMHWRVPVEMLRPHVPIGIHIDTFGGDAWIAVTPFTLWGARPKFLPPLPWLSSFHEMNVRTYVHRDGVPGVWFFSLDANRLIPVAGARALYRLPYVSAKIDFEFGESECDYTLERDAPAGRFHAAWKIGEELPRAQPGSLEFFLAERYCLYAESAGKLFRARIQHEPWPLQRAELRSWNTDIFAANGLETPSGEPMVHGGGPVHVAVWPLEST